MHTALGDVQNDFAVLARASKFGSDSHRHADQGSFALFYRGKALISPSGYFGRGYGTKHHFEWLKTTQAHNCILVDGLGQNNVPILESVGKFVSVDKENKVCVMDMSTAYPNISKWQRTIALSYDGITVSDEIEAHEDVEITYCLHALSPATSAGDNVIVEKKTNL
jgi:hypothetical protein